MSKSNLPDNWEWIPLEKFATSVGGYAFPEKWQGRESLQFPFIKVSDMNKTNGYYIESAKNTVDESILAKLRAHTYPVETIIFPKVGGAIATNKKRILAQDSIFDNNIMGIVINPESFIEVKWLFYFLLTIDLMDLAHSGPLPSIRQSTINQLEIPVPFPSNPDKSRQIQSLLLARIEQVLFELTEARRLHDKIVADSNRLMDAVLAEVFPNPENALEKGWILRTVEELSTDPQYGYTASANKQSDGVKFLRITDIQNGIVDWSKVPSCDCNKRDVDQYGLRDGDIVFARTGATTGKTFLVRQPPEAIFASYLIRLQITKLASPDFVYWYFQSPYYWQQINPRGGAQPNMNAQLLKKVRIPVPESFALQDQIVERILSVKSEIDGMQEQSKETGALLANLESSILAQAFRGEL